MARGICRTGRIVSVGLAVLALSGFVKCSIAATPIAGEQWTRTLGTSEFDWAGGVGADQLGNLYVTGRVVGQLPVPPGGANNSFVAKYNPSGDQSWIYLSGASATEFSSGMAVSPGGDFVISGSSDAAPGGDTLGLTDGFVRKYNADGVEQWTTLVGSDLVDNVFDVALSATGDSFVAGSSNELSSVVGHGFVSKLSPTGEIVWTQTLETEPSLVTALGVAVDNQGAAFVVGVSSYLAPLNGSSESGGAFVRKLDANGDLLWTRQFGDDYRALAYDVAVDPQGNAYVVGQGFVRKLSPNGEFLWDHQFDSMVSLTDISLDGLGRVVFGGSSNSAPFYAICGEDGAALSIRSLQIDSGYAPSIGVDGLGNVFVSLTVNASNPADIQLWKITYVPEPSCFALAAGLLLVIRPRRATS